MALKLKGINYWSVNYKIIKLIIVKVSIKDPNNDRREWRENNLLGQE